MEKMVVVVFDSESKAYEGTNALIQLDSEGSITVHGESVIKKNAEGKTVVLRTEDGFPIATLGGTAIGSLIGLLGGPYGVLVGAASGSIVGVTCDLYGSGVNAEFVDEISAKLNPGKYAVVADISEEWTTPLDVEMEKLGGQVFRVPKIDVESDQMEREIAAYDLEIESLETEIKTANDERKVKIQANIDKLKERRKKKLEKGHQRLEQIKKEHDSKVKALKEKSAHARGGIKASFDSRVTELNDHYHRTVAKWKNARADKLENKADLLDEKAKKLRNEAFAAKITR